MGATAHLRWWCWIQLASSIHSICQLGAGGLVQELHIRQQLFPAQEAAEKTLQTLHEALRLAWVLNCGHSCCWQLRQGCEQGCCH